MRGDSRCSLWPLCSGARNDYGFGQPFVTSPQHVGCESVNRLRKILKLLDPDIRAKNLHAARLALRGKWWQISRPTQPDPIFLVGCSRSGTTVTYETLVASGAFLNFGYEIPQFWNSLYGPLNNGWVSEAA